MVSFKLLGINVSVSYSFLSVLAILLLIDRTGMISVSLLAVILHESGHLVMLRLLKISVLGMDFSLSTVKVSTEGFIAPKRNLLVAAAGPFINLCCSVLLFVGSNALINFGAANLILFLFNIIPAKGLDGGDILYYILQILSPRRFHGIYNVISLFSIGLIILLGVALFCMTRSNITLLLVGIYLLILSFKKI